MEKVDLTLYYEKDHWEKRLVVFSTSIFVNRCSAFDIQNDLE